MGASSICGSQPRHIGGAEKATLEVSVLETDVFVTGETASSNRTVLGPPWSRWTCAWEESRARLAASRRTRGVYFEGFKVGVIESDFARHGST